MSFQNLNQILKTPLSFVLALFCCSRSFPLSMIVLSLLLYYVVVYIYVIVYMLLYIMLLHLCYIFSHCLRNVWPDSELTIEL